MNEKQREEERVWEIIRQRRKVRDTLEISSPYPPQPLGWKTPEADGSTLSSLHSVNLTSIIIGHEREYQLRKSLI